MARKEFRYRGYSLEELKKLTLDEFANLVNARQRRTLKRGFMQKHKKIIEKSRKYPDKVLRTHHRDLIILPEFVGRTFGVHNGKEFVTVKIEPEMIGSYLGEYALTRKRVQHSAPGMGATRASKYVSLK